MAREFPQIVWDEQLQADYRVLIKRALAEDLDVAGDWTTRALVPGDAVGQAAVVTRQDGVLAGVPATGLVLAAVDPRLQWFPETQDGQSVIPGTRIGVISGLARGIFSAERIVLNFLCRLSGIASLTRKYVDAVMGTAARIYDTRKTTPGWRRLEKYAVRCGGGWNHRGGLSAAVLIKDNHLAWGATQARGRRFTPADAVRQTQRFLQQHTAEEPAEIILEVEVDSLAQLEEVLPVSPEIVLLDNMAPEQLRQAVELRNRLNPAVELEASGGVNLSNVRAIAETGVERISVGALTHSAEALDCGLDWLKQ